MKQITAKAIFENNGKILFVKDHKGVWELPGGRIEKNEGQEQALKREIKEELGWDKIEIKDKIHTWSFKQFLVFVYECKTHEYDIQEHDEYSEYKWVSIPEINDLNMRQGYKQSIKRFLKKKNN